MGMTLNNQFPDPATAEDTRTIEFLLQTLQNLSDLAAKLLEKITNLESQLILKSITDTAVLPIPEKIALMMRIMSGMSNALVQAGQRADAAEFTEKYPTTMPENSLGKPDRAKQSAEANILLALATHCEQQVDQEAAAEQAKKQSTQQSAKLSETPFWASTEKKQQNTTTAENKAASCTPK